GFYNAYAHPGLRPVFTSDRLLATRDFVSNTTVFTSSSHGTQCLSVIGNNEPGVMVGTAPGATFVLCRTEESGSEMPVEEFNWAAAAEYADSIGADVISSSLGYTTFDDSTLNHTYEQLDGNTAPATIAADHAAAKGILVVNSAGNNGDKEWFYISAPADADSILAVGAVDENELAGLFSSNGFTVDGRVKPDVMAQGVKVVVANTGSLDYNTGSGTSFAAPGLAGMAACLVQAHPTRSAQDIINAIRRSADRFHQPDPKYGYGIPDMQLADLLLANVNINDFTSNPAPMVYPNPFRSSIAVVHYSEVREDARVELVDMFGRLLYTGYYILQPGYNQLVTDTAQMPAGMYVIRFVTESKSHELKAVHQ
ncbi:MAG TPA: S8 family peptidase, partial [Chitinophagales bacterium]|nr:S8 family peptidase [Chitinophagales bacterium]